MFGLTKTSTPEPPLPLTQTPADRPVPCPVFATMEEANVYRRDLTQQITDAALAGDIATVEALQTRYAALPLLICGLVVKQAQERLAGWQCALERTQEEHGAAHQAEQTAWAAYKEVENRKLLPSTDQAFAVARRASVHTTDLQDKLQRLQDGQQAARVFVQQAQAALTQTVYDVSGGLTAADLVLARLQEQHPVFVALTLPPPTPVETLPPFLTQIREAMAV